MDLVCYRPPYPDELLCGWILDLAQLNYPMDPRGIQRVLNFAFPFRYPPPKRGSLKREAQPLRTDYIKGIDRGVRQLQLKGYQIADPEQIITYNTPLTALSITQDRGDQARCIHTAMAEGTGGPFDMPALHLSIAKVRACPCCMQENPYIRTWHNLPGVEVCAVHGSVLETLDDWNTVSPRIHQIVLGNANRIEFARLAKTIYDNPRGLTLQDIKDCLPVGTKLRFHGEHSFVHVIDLLHTHQINYSEIAVQQRDDPSMDNDAILLSRTGIVSSFRCRECGTIWTDAEEAVRIGFGCPKCMKRKTPDARMSEMLHRIGDGEYKLIEPFLGMGATQDILHETCGQVTSSRLELKIWCGTKCRCEAAHTVEALQKLVDSYASGFTVLTYDPVKGIITLRHNECGTTMTPFLSGFKTSPVCPHCKTRERNQKRRDQIKAAMGDDYELIELPEVGKVHVRHKACGTDLIGEYNSFKKGRNCPLCTPFLKKNRGAGKVTYEAELLKEMNNWFKRDPLWIAGQHRQGAHTRKYYDALQNLVHKGYIYRLDRGVYSNRSNIPFELPETQVKRHMNKM